MHIEHGLQRKRSAFSYRLSLVREKGEPLRSHRLRSPIDAVQACRHFLPTDLDREIFGVLLVNTRNTVIGFNTVSIGTVNGSIVHPRETFKAAILGNASAIVCFHNHPSGDPHPSNEDRLLTARLKKAGDTIGIQLLDHVVLADAGHYESEISGQTYYSFKEHGEV